MLNLDEKKHAEKSLFVEIMAFFKHVVLSIRFHM